MRIQHRLLSDLIHVLPEFKCFISYVTQGVWHETVEDLVTQRKAYSAGLTPWTVLLLPSALVWLQSEKQADRHIIEVKLESDWGIFFRRRRYFLECHWHSVTYTGNTQWTNSIGCRHSVSVIHSFMGVSLDPVNVRHTMLLRLYPTWHVLALFEIMQPLVEEATRLRSWGSVVSKVIRLRTEFQYRVSLVDKVTKLRTEGCGFRIPAGVKALSLQNVRLRCGTHPVSFSKVTGLFPGIKLPELEVEYSSPTSVNLKN